MNHTDWLEANFKIPDGHHAGDPLLLRDVPWFTEPYLRGCDDATPFVNIYKATGAGGTTIGECILARQLAHRPIGAKFLYNIHIDDAERLDIASSRLFRQIDSIPEIALRYSDRSRDHNRARNRRFSLPQGHELIAQGANESNAQQVRAAFLLNDELWAWKHGLYAQMKQRTTGDFPFFKIINVGSAARTDTAEAAIEFREGCQAEFHLSCPKCSELFLPLPGNESRVLYNGHLVIQWDPVGTMSHKCSTVHMRCPHCDHEIKNKPRIRRYDLLEGAKYIEANPESGHTIDKDGNKIYRNYSCRFNSWIAWFSPWEDILERFLKATEALQYGDTSAMEDVVIKDMAKTYVGQGNKKSKLHISSDYDLVQKKISSFPLKIWTAPEDDQWAQKEVARYMSVDYQRTGHFWVWIHQTDIDGNMRLLWSGRVEGIPDTISEDTIHDWHTLDTLRRDFGIDEPTRVGVDAATDAYDSDIYYHCARLGFWCLRGDPNPQSYEVEAENENGLYMKTIKDTPHGPSIPCGSWVDEYTGQDIEAYRIHWNVKKLNDFADSILTGANKAYTLHLPRNMEKLEATPTGEPWRDLEKIEAQLMSLVYGDPRLTKTKQVRQLHKTVKRWHPKSAKTQEHLRDCFCMALVLMFLENYFVEVAHSEYGDEE